MGSKNHAIRRSRHHYNAMPDKGSHSIPQLNNLPPAPRTSRRNLGIPDIALPQKNLQYPSYSNRVIPIEQIPYVLHDSDIIPVLYTTQTKTTFLLRTVERLPAHLSSPGIHIFARPQKLVKNLFNLITCKLRDDEHTAPLRLNAIKY